ncbi:hypothetical protein [Taibaiella soli]|uniref:EGF-like domain-containing protein n=1 Tax=Taibaiella soli TaxID=1649169 RepID=A0A2W2A709_9BACT|nr:hypothetical protein [Taibaiella soli]PZF71001.1 hypothetical protein DN068_20065 [Taibaiella soli]
MKFWKHTLITACSFVGIASTVLYTACEKDSCTDLTCKNGGSCADGFCRCPTGFEGAQCETRTVDRFTGTYYGNSRCNALPSLVDTVVVFLKTMPNTVGLVKMSNITDTLYGTVADNDITFPAQTGNNTARYVNAVIDGNAKKITVYDQQIYDVAANKQNVCNFIGFTQTQP